VRAGTLAAAAPAHMRALAQSGLPRPGPQTTSAPWLSEGNGPSKATAHAQRAPAPPAHPAPRNSPAWPMQPACACLHACTHHTRARPPPTLRAHSTLRALRAREAALRPNPAYMDAAAPAPAGPERITPHARMVAISWMAEAAEYLELQPATLHLAAGLLDRFLAAALPRGVPRSALQMVAVACIMVAAKELEVGPGPRGGAACGTARPQGARPRRRLSASSRPLPGTRAVSAPSRRCRSCGGAHALAVLLPLRHPRLRPPASIRSPRSAPAPSLPLTCAAPRPQCCRRSGLAPPPRPRLRSSTSTPGARPAASRPKWRRLRCTFW
jgi:hypothetical protein